MLCFHGTGTLARARRILAEGFNPGSYFASHLEDVLAYGGKFVFEVAFDRTDDPDRWQFVEKDRVPPDRIVSLRKYAITRMRESRKLRRALGEAAREAFFARWEERLREKEKAHE